MRTYSRTVAPCCRSPLGSRARACEARHCNVQSAVAHSPLLAAARRRLRDVPPPLTHSMSQIIAPPPVPARPNAHQASICSSCKISARGESLVIGARHLVWSPILAQCISEIPFCVQRLLRGGGGGLIYPAVPAKSLCLPCKTCCTNTRTWAFWERQPSAQTAASTGTNAGLGACPEALHLYSLSAENVLLCNCFRLCPRFEL